MKTGRANKPLRVLVAAVLASFFLYECMCNFGDFGDGGSGCGPTPCETTEDCPHGEHCCEDKFCHECCTDEHCPDGIICCADRCRECCTDVDCPGFPDAYCSSYYCVDTCPTQGDFCQSGIRDCCPWLVCDRFLNICMPPCEKDADCHNRTMRYAEDLKCVNGTCDFEHCTSDNNCPGGKICFEGNCLTPLDCDQLAYCMVKPTASVVREGAGIQLSAAAFLRNYETTPVLGFEWSTSDPAVAGVDTNGIVTGGSNDGNAIITAKVLGCETSCEASVTNYTVASDTRIVVVDEFSGTPIEGATVALGSEAPATTDTGGIATFTTSISADSPADVTVSHADYDYVTLKSIESSDVIVYLSPICNQETAGGITGKFDFTRIHCKQGEDCPVRMGIASLSMPGNLMNMNFLELALTTALCVPSVADPDLPSPAGIQLCQNGDCTQDAYKVDGIPGIRVAWGLGGRLGLGDLIEIIGPIFDGDESHPPSLFAGLLSLYAKFYSSVVSDVEIVPGEYKRLDMQLNVPMSKSMTITPPALPLGVYDAVFVYSAAVVRDAGLVLLGAAVGIDSKDIDDPPDGTIEDPITLPTADLSGRLSDSHIQRMVIALALNTTDINEPSYYSVQVLFLDSFEGSHQLDPFLLPAQATYDPPTRHLEMLQSPPADCFQITFSDENNAKWQILGETAASFDLPPAPPEADRASRATVIAVDLIDGATYQALPQFNDTNLGDLIRLVQALSYTEVP